MKEEKSISDVDIKNLKEGKHYLVLPESLLDVGKRMDRVQVKLDALKTCNSRTKYVVTRIEKLAEEWQESREVFWGAVRKLFPDYLSRVLHYQTGSELLLIGGDMTSLAEGRHKYQTIIKKQVVNPVAFVCNKCHVIYTGGVENHICKFETTSKGIA